MITERTLKKWRRDALRTMANAEDTKQMFSETSPGLAKAYIREQEKILQMTQELLDQHLMRRKE